MKVMVVGTTEVKSQFTLTIQKMALLTKEAQVTMATTKDPDQKLSQVKSPINLLSMTKENLNNEMMCTIQKVTVTASQLKKADLSLKSFRLKLTKMKMSHLHLPKKLCILNSLHKLSAVNLSYQK